MSYGSEITHHSNNTHTTVVCRALPAASTTVAVRRHSVSVATLSYVFTPVC